MKCHEFLLHKNYAYTQIQLGKFTETCKIQLMRKKCCESNHFPLKKIRQV